MTGRGCWGDDPGASRVPWDGPGPQSVALTCVPSPLQYLLSTSGLHGVQEHLQKLKLLQYVNQDRSAEHESPQHPYKSESAAHHLYRSEPADRHVNRRAAGMGQLSKTRLKEVFVACALLFLLTVFQIFDNDWSESMAQDDPALIAKIRRELFPPSREPYNLWDPDLQCWGQSHQMYVIQALTKNKTGGFFIESGAHNGESMTNSLLLEKDFGWQGLLVEPSPLLFKQIHDKARKAWSIRACLSNQDSSFSSVFRDQLRWGLGSVEDGEISQFLSDTYKEFSHPMNRITRYSVDCYPIYSILLALNRTTVDFFSLDIEGMEMGVLAYMPWHLVDIKILLVENFLAAMWNPQSEQMRWLMESHGYMTGRMEHDLVFVRRDSEYADGAEDIIRRVREEITLIEQPEVANPFND